LNKIAPYKKGKMKSNQLKSYLSPLTLAGILLWFTFINSPAFALQSNTPIDSITLTGRFVSPCQIPAQVKIWRYNPGESMNTGFDMPVSNTGELPPAPERHPAIYLKGR